MTRTYIFKYSYEQMNKELQRMKQAYPEKVSLNVAAFSVDKRAITEVILGRQGAKYHILIQASMHGREYMNTALVMRQIEDYLKWSDTECYKGHLWRELYNEICFHVLPMVNPDGVTISQEGVGGIRNPKLREGLLACYRRSLNCNRKNGEIYVETSEKACQAYYFRRWKANACGVDINRNFEAGWEMYKGPCETSSEGFKGAFPGSETETQAVLNIARKYEITCCIAYHSSGSVVYWDYGSEGMVFEADRYLAEIAGEITGYSLESTVQNGVDAAGCSDYFVLKYGIPAVTIENGSGDCPLPEWEYEVIYRRNRELWPGLAYGISNPPTVTK